MIEVDTCIQCGKEAGHGSILLDRPRPMRNGSYLICLACARRIRKEQDERAQQAIKIAERAGV